MLTILIAAALLTHDPPALMLAASNALRASAGLAPHLADSRLTAAAQDHARFMARTGQFSHGSNGGSQSRAARHGFPGAVHENIGWNHSTVAGVFKHWRDSPAHYASILSDCDRAGFAYSPPYWVAVYGSEREKPDVRATVVYAVPKVSAPQKRQFRPVRRLFGGRR